MNAHATEAAAPSLLFFGASVTAQAGDNGYFDQLRPLLQARAIGMQRLAYGSCHFDDAGFHAVPELPLDGVSHCLLDWNTTGQSRFDPVKLNFVLNHLLAHRVLPVFLLLPQERTLAQDREAETQAKATSALLGLPLLDLRPGFQPAGLLRDNVHTTPAGARFYAARLLDFLDSTLLSKPRPDLGVIQNALHAQRASVSFSFTSLSGPWDVAEAQAIEVDYRLTGPLPELLFDLQIGPDSPIVEVSVNGAVPLRLSVWDPWCHYERSKQLTLVPERLFRTAPAQGRVRIMVTRDRPDYASCRRTDFDYAGPRALHVRRVRAANVALDGVRCS